MGKQDQTLTLGGHPTRRVVFPWFLLLIALGLGGYAYWTVHRPLVEEVRKKDAALVDLAKAASDAKRDSDAARAAQAELQRTAEQLKQAREDLARSAAQKAEDAQLLAQLKKEVGSGGADIQGAEGQITVTMVDRVLFHSGQADLTPQGEQVLRKLGGVLSSVDKLIEVSGHADNLAVDSETKELYPTNWELSTARATNVVRFLQEEVGIKPSRLKAAGFSSYRPVASNATAVGRAKNRRIEILLLPARIKVVKGKFTDELAAAESQPPSGAATRAPRLSDRERAKAVAAIRAKQAAKKPPR